MNNELVEKIKAHLATAGNVVQIGNAYRAVVYKNPDAFKATASGVYVRRGRSWDCIATTSQVLVSVRFGRYVTE